MTAIQNYHSPDYNTLKHGRQIQEQQLNRNSKILRAGIDDPEQEGIPITTKQANSIGYSATRAALLQV